MEQLLTPDEVCEVFKIKKDKLYKLTSRRLIPFLKIGRELRFDVDELRKAFVVNTRIGRILS